MPTLDPNNLSTSMGRWDIEIDNDGYELVIRVSDANGLRLVTEVSSSLTKNPEIRVYVDEA